MRIGLDTSVLLALIDEKDIWHEKAVAIKNALIQQSDAEIAIFDCVLTETISILARRIHEKRRSIEFEPLFNHLIVTYPLESILWLYPLLPAYFEEVINLVRTSNGELNFNDSLIAIACRDRDIKFLASFDKDFDSISWLKRVATPSDIE